MFEYTTGNILDIHADAIVNTVNTVGVMGKGIALAFKKAFPDNYREYRRNCESGYVRVGSMFVTETNLFTPKYIVNFPTKEHWRNPSRYDFIEKGLDSLHDVIVEKQMMSIAIPPLGCGNGGLQWRRVREMIQERLGDLKEVRIIIVEPGFVQRESKEASQELTPQRAMFIKALHDYQVMDYVLNLLVAQKIAYFLQAFGEELNLRFEKGHYGPYAHNLTHLLNHLNGYYLDFPVRSIKPDDEVVIRHFDQISIYIEANLSQDQKARLKRLASLIEGFESPYGLELLATVDFVRRQMHTDDLKTLISEIHNWTDRKKSIMKPKHIEIAWQRLHEVFDYGLCAV